MKNKIYPGQNASLRRVRYKLFTTPSASENSDLYCIYCTYLYKNIQDGGQIQNVNMYIVQGVQYYSVLSNVKTVHKLVIEEDKSKTRQRSLGGQNVLKSLPH